MANFVYKKAAKLMVDPTDAAKLDWENDNIRVALFKSSYTPDKDHDYLDDITPGTHEADCSGYTGGWGGSGRLAVSNRTITEAGAGVARVELDSDNPATWSNLGGSPTCILGGALIFRKGTSDDTDALLIAWIDTVTGTPSFPFTTNGSDFTLQFDADGVINLNI